MKNINYEQDCFYTALNRYWSHKISNVNRKRKRQQNTFLDCCIHGECSGTKVMPMVRLLCLYSQTKWHIGVFWSPSCTYCYQPIPCCCCCCLLFCCFIELPRIWCHWISSGAQVFRITLNAFISNMIWMNNMGLYVWMWWYFTWMQGIESWAGKPRKS